MGTRYNPRSKRKKIQYTRVDMCWSGLVEKSLKTAVSGKVELKTRSVLLWVNYYNDLAWRYVKSAANVKEKQARTCVYVG